MAKTKLDAQKSITVIQANGGYVIYTSWLTNPEVATTIKKMTERVEELFERGI